MAAKEVRVSAENQNNVNTRKKRIVLSSIVVILLTIAAIIVGIIINSPAYETHKRIKRGFEYYRSGEFELAEKAWTPIRMKVQNSADVSAQDTYVKGYKPTAKEFLKYGEDLLYEYAFYVAHRSFADAIPLFAMIPDNENSDYYSEKLQILLDTYVGEYECVSAIRYCIYRSPNSWDVDLVESIIIDGLHYGEENKICLDCRDSTPVALWEGSYAVRLKDWKSNQYTLSCRWDASDKLYWEYDAELDGNTIVFTQYEIYEVTGTKTEYIWERITAQGQGDGSVGSCVNPST